MCGILGLYSHSPTAAGAMPRMLAAIAHRGPDSDGLWNDGSGIHFGHRRLSILDLSPAGAQPMHSPDGRWVIVFNGEIYNFSALRAELDRESAPAWKGHSDTEIILAAVSRWGFERTLEKLTGMFAFALWDRQEKALILVRDRMGEKPLYYGRSGKDFIFASELKALVQHPDFDKTIDRNALNQYIRSGYTAGEQSIYARIHKLRPGHFIRLTESMLRASTPAQQIPYWSLRDVAKAGQTSPLRINDAEAISALDLRLRSVIRDQMVADVPIGAFLSGGIDSSTIVALMQAQSSNRVRTFSIGFAEADYDEAKNAKAVAHHLGTDHTELYVSPATALDVVPLLPQIYDEPFADSSQIPTFLVAQLARQSVTVSLSGDGGDEIFGGYNRHTRAASLWKNLGWLPAAMRAPLAMALHKTVNSEKIFKASQVIGARNKADVYERLTSHWADELVLGTAKNFELRLDQAMAGTELNSFAAEMMLADGLQYLPDDILVKVDRATMAVSLEGRVPFLDHHLVEFAWQLPMSMKIRNGQGKWILRRVLEQYVPSRLFERPKMGFGIPLGEWLRGPLREWAEALLDESAMRNEGYLNAPRVQQRWKEHLQGKGNWQHGLWAALMFQAWLRRE